MLSSGAEIRFAGVGDGGKRDRVVFWEVLRMQEGFGGLHNSFGIEGDTKVRRGRESVIMRMVSTAIVSCFPCFCFQPRLSSTFRVLLPKLNQKVSSLEEG